jgi:hypothetical protein
MVWNLSCISILASEWRFEVLGIREYTYRPGLAQKNGIVKLHIFLLRYFPCFLLSDYHICCRVDANAMGQT